ncbi:MULTISPECIES: Crp/Fnr family transcriptional regulator [Rhodopseudomonas]|uniref:Crp/Fnr family transcriptional regulator n=1 Tax=Rhodopseudomonas TaxID=1073 RepID=UPI0005CA56C2|nr:MULTISPECIES: Crp/Fnr family transcriptional regulator [Rhodopseudomonas]MDF3814113.1 Crp/Fnr family transcriptional regulator [Rhodopseudomonas sp. BAL398]WOK19623.1 Crp/Fnr family transcriptional regulator [Rhodopseudomonas sp. BAL398]
MASFRQSPNDLLASLPEATFEQLGAACRTVDLVLSDILVEAGAQLRLIYFPHSGVISKLVSLAQGDSVEVGMIGREGVFGAAAGDERELSRTTGIVRFPGTASVIEVERFQAICAQSEPLRAALMQCQWRYLMQAERTAACNAAHSIEARFCRQLLMFRARARSDKLPLTQDVVAQMLGVQRNSISLVAIALQQAGLLRYSRGHLEILDVDGLTERSCTCYQPVEPDHGALLGAGVTSRIQRF